MFKHFIEKNENKSHAYCQTEIWLETWKTEVNSHSLRAPWFVANKAFTPIFPYAFLIDTKQLFPVLFVGYNNRRQSVGQLKMKRWSVNRRAKEKRCTSHKTISIGNKKLPIKKEKQFWRFIPTLLANAMFFTEICENSSDDQTG